MNIDGLSDQPISASPPAPQPERRFTPHYGRDELGFLDLARSNSLLDAGGLLEHPAVLIKAQPWMGKTTFARRMHAWLSGDPLHRTRFAAFHELTCFEEAIDVSHLLPSWWAEWRNALSGAPACWIIDGLDECEVDHPGLWKRIVREITQLPAKSHRENLRLIVLSRDRDWLEEFERELRPLYAEIGLDGPRVLRMAPLDRDEAARMLGSTAALDRVAELIGRHPDLAAITGYPRVLSFLGTRRGGGSLSSADTWEAILKDLLEEHNCARKSRFSTELEQRFEAVARIAVISVLSGYRDLYLSSGELSSEGLTLGDAFPLTPLADRAKAMRNAARESIRIGGPFRSSIEGGFCFGQRNIRDWFCAFGLRDLELEQLTSVVAHGDKPLQSLVDMLRLLKQVTKKPEVGEWLASILTPFGPSNGDAPWGVEEALQQLDELERIASKSPSNLYLHDDEALMRLEAPGLGKRIADRLRDVSRAATARKLLLDVASALKTPEAVAPALDIVLDDKQDMRLRERAAILVRSLGTADDAARLDPLARTQGTDEDERSLQAQAILTLLIQGVWTVHQAALYAPPENPGVTDTTSFLIYEMEKRVTAADARVIIANYLDKKRRGGKQASDRQSIGTYRLKQLRLACINKLVEEPQLSQHDEHMLASLSVRMFADPEEIDIHQLIVQRLRRHSYGRRCLYQYFASSVLKGNSRPPHYLRRLLSAEDVSWLLSRAKSKWSAIKEVWADLYFLAVTSEPGVISNVNLERTLAAIRRHAPSVPEEFEAAKRERERQEREIEEQRQSRREKIERHTITEVIDQILRREDWTGMDRLRQLSLICFSGDLRQYGNVDGKWTDLDAIRQREVLEACRKGLKDGIPTMFPNDKAVTTWNFAEACAFLALLERGPLDEWLDSKMIEKWLPSVLRAHMPKALEAVIACAAKDRLATANVLIAMIDTELTNGENPLSVANFIPAALWPGEVAQRVLISAKDESLPSSTRACLLEALAAYESSAALPLAVEWTEQKGTGDEAAVLYHKGLDVRLALDPEGAWPLVEADYQQRGGDALRDLSSLVQRRGDFGASLSNWTTARLNRLAQMLMETFPLAPESVSTPIDYDGSGTYDALRPVRDGIINILIQRRLDGDSDALQSLFDAEPKLKERFEWETQQHKALRQLGKLGQKLASVPPSAVGAGIPVEQLVRLLDEGDYRLIRSGDDLTKAIVYVLKFIENSAPYDVSMLYGKNEPPDKGLGIKGKTESKKVRRHLEEDALQAYILRRLEDLLPSRVPGVRIKISREPQVKYQRRFDLEVVAPTADREWVTVVIEMKWSDNPETKTGLPDQLVADYLLGHSLDHGIYLVGWCGAWKERGNKGRDIQQLRAYLADQVKAVHKSKEGTRLTVEPMVLDLRWRDDLPDQGLVPMNDQRFCRANL